VSWGLGTIAGFIVLLAVAFVLLRDITQQRHTILRNYPVIGHLRYFFENLGEYFRQYFFAGDRDEMPFNRATRGWVYRLAKNEGGIIGFGSTYDLRQPGSILFVNAPFPVLETDHLPTPPLSIGEGQCRYPLLGRSVVNVSGMSFGAISAPAVRALSMGAKEAGCWMDTGEGGLSPYHLEGGCDVIMQIGTAKYGVRRLDGSLDRDRLRELGHTVGAFEIKLSQGAKPGKGGVLPAMKVTEEIARIRGIPAHEDSISPNRHLDIGDIDQLLDQVMMIRDLTELKAGRDIVAPLYSFIHHGREPGGEAVRAAGVVIVEGTHVLCTPGLVALFDIRVFVDTPADIRFIRRLLRDQTERGRTPESVIAQYLATVRPGHERLTEPSRVNADFIIADAMAAVRLEDPQAVVRLAAPVLAHPLLAPLIRA
jgi:uridine kinase